MKRKPIKAMTHNERREWLENQVAALAALTIEAIADERKAATQDWAKELVTAVKLLRNMSEMDDIPNGAIKVYLHI